MDRIDATRVLVGGLVAGVILTVGFFLSQVILVNEAVVATFEELGAQRLVGERLLGWVLLQIVVGITAVWLYAVMRPRFGSGPSTAVRAGLTIWFLTIVLPVAGLHALGFSGSAIVGLTAAIPGVVGIPLATVAGAWFYAEAAQREAAPATVARET